MSITHPYLIHGEIHYHNETFQIGIQQDSGGIYLVSVFQWFGDAYEHIETFAAVPPDGAVMTLGEAFGAGADFIIGYTDEAYKPDTGG